ncbi:tetratricopeptide repeat protein [Halothiobacillus sp. DCM-1]|uniref:tetratricopeptide repeat protein n=1 Tax=Halothiobacillus sp. DCM-1 TaxID=3112558 RepID=UPI0032433539
MIQPSIFPNIPDELRPALDALAHPDAAIDCHRVTPVLDWFYSTHWQHETARDEDTRRLLPWFLHCQPARAAELADVLCFRLIESGQPQDAIALAAPALDHYPEGALRHTYALALFATGQINPAIQQLEIALTQDRADTLPGEQRINALLDLARLYQGQGALFKAIKPAKSAIELAAAAHADDLLLEATTLLVDQLIEQGGNDEAWGILAPLLGDQPNQSQQSLWTLAFNRLGEQLSDTELARGARLFIAARAPEPLVQLMIRRSAARDVPAAGADERRQTALILALAYQAPIDVVAPLAAQLLMRDKDRQHPSAPLIAAASMAVAERPDHRSIKRAHWHRDAMIQFISVAKHQGVPEAAVKRWAEDERLLREHGVIWRAIEQLTGELQHPPEWLPEALALARTLPEPLD